MLLFADDMIMCTEKEDLERNLAEMKVIMEKWGMSTVCTLSFVGFVFRRFPIFTDFTFLIRGCSTQWCLNIHG